jgi:argininosuccinate synthase
MDRSKVILAYSGGLDTSAAIIWLREQKGLEVVAVTVDVGQALDIEMLQSRAFQAGASELYIVDAKSAFVENFVLPNLKANGLYEGRYPLATALSRPLIASALVAVARAEGAGLVAHGCTGKGNDQVRFELALAALAPALEVIAPLREWRMNREQELSYLHEHALTVSSATRKYSIDENLWGRSIEAGPLEDEWNEPEEDAFEWTVPAKKAPDLPEYIEIEFERGVPVALNGTYMSFVDIIWKLNELGGKHGVGRIDMIESRVVGIKSREVYEAPAAVILVEAHSALEQLCLTRDLLSMKRIISEKWSQLVYEGLWFTDIRRSVAAFIEETQRNITGVVRVKLHKGQCTVVGRKSPYALYRKELATYGAGDVFDQSAASGYLQLLSLPLKSQSLVDSANQDELSKLLGVVKVERSRR